MPEPLENKYTFSNLLLLHGALGARSDFDHFQKHDFGTSILHTLDFHGHGEEDGMDQDGFRIEAMAEQLIDFLYAYPQQKFHLFGYSMGGYVALYAASLIPDLCLSITTLGTKYDWNPETAVKEAAMLKSDEIKQNFPEWAQRLKRKHGASRWERVVHHTANMMLDLGSNPRLGPEQLLKVKVPCIIGRGSKDKMVGEEESKAMASLIPNARYVELEGMPHALEKIPVEVLTKLIQP